MGVTRVANVTGLDRIGVPVVMVCRPNARSIAVSQGKGLDLDSAKASGVMEAVEIHCAERVDRPLKLGAAADLEATHPLAQIDRLAKTEGGTYHAELQMLWTEGVDLMAGTAAWLPYEVVHTNYTLPRAPGAGCFDASSNGLASGNHRLEAICHGLCEVIERDAITLWSRRGHRSRAATRIRLETIDDPGCAVVLDRLAAAGLTTAVWDITSDVGVATVYCLITDEEGSGGHPGVGSGTHPCREIATLRALTEAVQVRMTYVSGARDDLTAYEFSNTGRAETMNAARGLMTGQPQRDFASVPSHGFETFRDDVLWILDRLKASGVTQAVAVDLTLSGLPVSIARVVVPGLEGPHDRPGYVPGPRAVALAEGTVQEPAP